MSIYWLSAGVAALGFGFAAMGGLGLQKAGLAATTASGGLLNSGRKWLMIVSELASVSWTPLRRF
jgi:hypothetical protein